MQQSLRAGLRQEFIMDPEEPERAIAEEFRAGEFEKLLRRAAERGIKTESMDHRCVDEGMTRHVLGFAKDFDPLEVFQKWRREGCDGVFTAYFKVPKELIDAFERERGAATGPGE